VNANEHRELRELLGAYVLAQLGEVDQTAVDHHLAGCTECRAEVRGLQPMAVALRGLDPTLSADPAPPADLGGQVLAHIQQRRRSAARRSRVRRSVAGVLAAAAVAAAFVSGSWYAGARNEPPVTAVTLRLDQPGISAAAGLVKHTWGTELRLEATGLTDGASYTATFVRDDGSRVEGGSFLGTGSQAVRCSLNAALPVDSASELAISDASGHLVMDADLG